MPHPGVVNAPHFEQAEVCGWAVGRSTLKLSRARRLADASRLERMVSPLHLDPRTKMEP